VGHDGDALVVTGGTSPPAVAAAAAALAAALEGTGPPVVPVDPHSGGAVGAPTGLPPGTVAVLATSGSTGRPRLVALGASALLAGADATHARLRGPGRWLLALPVHHVAGCQVLVRAVRSGGAGLGSALHVLDTSAGFRARPFAAAVAGIPCGAPRYTALVPTQLGRVLADPAASAALAELDAVLVGGAATPPDLLRRAREAGVHVVTTFGMTETGGGCVYDGVPLPGVDVAAVGGRLEIAGPTLASGYVEATRDAAAAEDRDPPRFLARAGRTWFRSGDLGEVADGRVEVLGRADDVIVTGGEKVHPAVVERALAGVPGIAEAVVVGVPDLEWGHAVVALVVPSPGAAAPTTAQVRARVTARLGPRAAPRAVVVADALPRHGLGKVDRAASAALATGILAGPASG
jgi:O-succinylbenzoic acid--CoA ligase